MSSKFRVDVTEAEMVALIRMTETNGEHLHASFGGGAIVVAPENKWALDALVEMRKRPAPPGGVTP